MIFSLFNQKQQIRTVETLVYCVRKEAYILVN